MSAPRGVLALAADRARKVNGQVFTVRRNEILLMSQSRPLRSVQRNEGWTPEQVLDHALPTLAPAMLPLDRSQDVFTWDPA